MRKIFFILIIVLCHPLFSISQNGWRQIEPYPTDKIINRIVFINEQTGFFAGHHNLLFKTTNNGNNWFRILQGSEEHLAGMKFKNQYTGFVTGSEGAIKRTTNGGNNWYVLSGAPSDHDTRCIIYMNNKWYIAGYQYYNGNVIGYFGKSTNEGLSWNFSYLLPASIYFVPIGMFFINETTGYMAGPESKILKTTNGGTNWSYQNVGNSSNYQSVYFINTQTGFVSGINGILLRSTDEGATWNNILDTINTNNHFYEILFLNSTTGFVAGNRILKTTNGGNNWYLVHQYPTTSNYDLYTCIAYNNNKLFTAGTNGEIATSTNLGVNWQKYNFSDASMTDYTDLFPIDSNIIYAACNNNIYKTTNGGTNWIKQQNIIGRVLQFLNKNTGYVISGEGYAIYKTTNGGEQWSDLSYPGNDVYKSFKFLDGNTGVIGGYNVIPSSISVILHTTNGGTNWNRIPIQDLQRLTAIDMTDVNTIYAGTNNYGGSSSDIYKSTDRGNSWIKKTFLNNRVFDIRFMNSQTGYAVNTDNTNYIILKTTNAGEDWYSVNTGNAFITKLTLLPPSSIYATGYYYTWNYNYGVILKSTNDGLDWNVDYVANGDELKTVRFADNNFGMAGGHNLLLKYTPETPTIVSGNFNDMPNTFYLHQNYPNPFNNSTSIIFEVPKQINNNLITATQNIKITIYDITGRIVEAIINNNYLPGIYRTQWNGSKYSSGVYFYRLTADGFSETKRMVLLK